MAFPSFITKVMLLAIAFAPPAARAADPATRPAGAPPAATRPAAVRPATRPAGVGGLAYVLHLPGIGGARGIDRRLVRGLSLGGFGDAAVYDWTANDPGLNALVAYRRNRDEARTVARRIAEYARRHPTRAIHLTAHSGGTGVAVWALEALPDGVTVRSLTLIASALSPDYDLTAALRRVDGPAFAFNSLADTLVLGTGTTLFGTIDGKKVESAGRVGFVAPGTADPEQYAKLKQYEYDPVWTRYNNLGDHIGPMTTAFARHVIAPLALKGTQPPASPTTRPVR